MAHHLGSFIAYIYATLHFSHGSSQQAAMSSLSVADPSLGPEWWTKQEPKFKEAFPPRDKSNFRSMRSVRLYNPKKPVQWP